MLQALFLSLGLLVLLGAGFAEASPSTTHRVAESPAEIKSSWTRSDIRNARPMSPRVPSTPTPRLSAPAQPTAKISASDGDFFPGPVTELPLRLHGKVFFRMGLVAYECSATLVESKNGNSVFTAGHCIYDPETGQWASDFLFVPGYENGSEPFGRYAATAIQVAPGWRVGGDFSSDIGVATLAGTPSADLGGAEKIAFDMDITGRRYTLYGYPGKPDPPYDGERLIGCRVNVIGRGSGDPPTIVANPCMMAQGGSGGAWMLGRYLNSVFSYIYCDSVPTLCGNVYGPYFSDAAKQLYMSEEVGGAIRPSVRFTFKPPNKVTKRKVLFKFTGEGSTPLGYRCRFDRRPFTDCRARTTISRLRPGKHALRVRSIDQTGQLSRNVITRKFRVSLPR